MAKTIEKPFIDPYLLQEVETSIKVERQVIVHCVYPSQFEEGNLIRIWPTTVLLDRESGHKSRLLHAENISYYPYWTPVPQGKNYHFTLIFSGLPKQCTEFDLIEVIPEAGGFYVPRIKRNTKDIYNVTIC